MRFLIGSQNFGMDLPNSDKDYVLIDFPSASDLCKQIPHPLVETLLNGSVTKTIDVRALPGLFYKSNIDTLQLLYSKEVTNGGLIEQYFRDHEEYISTMNIPRLYQSVMGSALNRFKKGTSKDLAHIIFGFKLLVKFADQGFTNLRGCFEHNEHEMYQAIRTESYNAWLMAARSWEEIALTKKELYMAKVPNDAFMEQMNWDIGHMVVTTLSGR